MVVIIDISFGMVNIKGIFCVKNIDSNINIGVINMVICNVEFIVILIVIFILFL